MLACANGVNEYKERSIGEINSEGFKYRCAELYEKGWVHIVNRANEIIGKVPVWNVLRTMSPRKLYKWIHDKHKTYKLSRILHQLQPSTDNIKEAFTVTDIRQTNGVTLRSLL